jgi:L-iditol 2-dehydrogenase
MPATMLRVTLVEPGRFVVERTGRPSPGPGEALLEVRRVGVCGSDLAIYRGRHPYAKMPLVMGHEFSGVIAELGPGVDGPAVGTRVAVIPHLVCGRCGPCRSETFNFCEQLRCMGAEADGAHVEYLAVPAGMALPIPDRMSLEDAALLEPACVGYHAARRGDIGPGDHVLVVGAGPIGIFAVQSCRALGAQAVYVADMDPFRLGLARRLGADGTIDVSRESLADGLARLAGSREAVGLYFDCVGETGAALDGIIATACRGSRVVVVGVLQAAFAIPHLPDFVQHELRLSGTTMYVPRDFRDMIGLLSKGEIRTDGMITHTFDLEDVGAAIALMESRRENVFKIMLRVNEKGREPHGDAHA